MARELSIFNDEETEALEIACQKLEENPELIHSEMWQQSWLWDEGLSVSDLREYRELIRVDKMKNCPYWTEPS